MVSQSSSTALIDPNWQLYTRGQTITYSFLDGVPADYPIDFYQGRYLNGFSPFTLNQREAMRKVLDLVESATTLRFQEAPPGTVADIRIGNTSQPGSGGVNIKFRASATDPLRPINDIYMSNKVGNDTTGARQGSCRLIHAANCRISLQPECVVTMESRSGLRVTEPTGVQLRVVPDHLAGVFCLARVYSA